MAARPPGPAESRKLEGTLADRASEAFGRYQDGDSSAIGELIAMLTPILWHTIRALRLSREDTDDVLQAAWLALAQRSDDLDPALVLRWMLNTARAEAYRRIRQNARTRDSAQVPQDVPLDGITEQSGAAQGLEESPPSAEPEVHTDIPVWEWWTPAEWMAQVQAARLRIKTDRRLRKDTPEIVEQVAALPDRKPAS